MMAQNQWLWGRNSKGEEKKNPGVAQGAGKKTLTTE